MILTEDVPSVLTVRSLFLTSVAFVFFHLLLPPGYAGRAVRCLPGPGWGALPVQPVGSCAEACRGGRSGRVQLLGARQHRPLDRPRRRRLWRRHQRVPGPLPRRPEIQPHKPQTVKGLAFENSTSTWSCLRGRFISEYIRLCGVGGGGGRFSGGLEGGAVKSLRSGVSVLIFVLVSTLMCLLLQ